MSRDFTRNQTLIPLFCIAAVALIPGCQGNEITALGERQEAGPYPTFDLVVEPSEPILAAGETVQLKAYLRNSQTGTLRAVDAEAVIRWESALPKRASISDQGLLEAHERGEVTVIATLAGSQNGFGHPTDQAEARVRVQ